ncbi:peptidoglycan-binding protein LysM [Kitasatospora sp. NBC_00070]|uniref:peptidoglycan-binding protein LysM n=1 Tax=Kitasatospora sp. NBC_00070 TaxID=2975962 RepID=UPI00324BC724
MPQFSFAKEAGPKLVDLLTSDSTNAEEQLKKHIANIGLGDPNISATVEGDKVILKGEVSSQEEREKIVLAIGNIAGVASIDDQLTVTDPVAQASRFVTVVSGDTLPAISQRVYGSPNKYLKIFEANKPMLAHPDKIYPGQLLRLPD